MSESRSVVGAAWSAESSGRRRAHPPLSREQIVAGALAFLQEHGLAGLSMRRLAQYLDTAATSLYWHVPTKEQLLDLVLDEILGQVPVMPVTDDWAADVVALLTALRSTLRAHRGAATLVVSRPTVGPKTLTVFEFLLSTLRRAGFSDRQLPYAYDLLTNYVIGSVLVEASWAGERPPDDEDVAGLDAQET